MKHFFILLLVALCSSVSAKVVNVCDFGAKPDSRIDCTAVVAAAVKELKAGDTLLFPLGRYDFYAENAAAYNYHESNTTDVFPKRLAIWLRGLTDITIDGNLSMWIMHGRIQPLTIDSCSNIKVQNITIDWDYPLTAQGYVWSSNESGFEVTVDDAQYPFEVVDGKIIFKSEGWSSGIFSIMEFEDNCEYKFPQLVAGTGDATSWQAASYQVSRSRGNKVFFAKPTPDSYSPKAGNTIVMRHNERAHAGIFVNKSKDVSFNLVGLHHTGGLGILCQYSENLTFKTSGIAPNLAKHRYFSSHDDGFHIMGCRGYIVIDDCSWQGLMDDAINIHGTALKIVKIEGKKIICRFMHHQSVGMEWGQVGNEVGFLDHQTLATIGTSKITSIRPLSTTDIEIMTTKLPKSLKEGDALENLYWTPNSVLIENSQFLSGRARGILVSVPGTVVIKDNAFNTSGAAILIAGDANGWYETGAVNDVTISNNTFFDCNTSTYQFCNGVISVDPEIPKSNPKKPFHSNIKIYDNKFYPTGKAFIYAKSVGSIFVSGNELTHTNMKTIDEQQTEEPDKIIFVDCINVNCYDEL